MKAFTSFINNIHYFVALSLFLMGFYTLLTNTNLVKKLIGLNIMDTSIFLFLVSLGYVKEGATPLLRGAVSQGIVYINPLPHALVLTGIVVSFSISTLAFALIIKLYSFYGSIDTGEIMEIKL